MVDNWEANFWVARYTIVNHESVKLSDQDLAMTQSVSMSRKKIPGGVLHNDGSQKRVKALSGHFVGP